VAIQEHAHLIKKISRMTFEHDSFHQFQCSRGPAQNPDLCPFHINLKKINARYV